LCGNAIEPSLKKKLDIKKKSSKNFCHIFFQTNFFGNFFAYIGVVSEIRVKDFSELSSVLVVLEAFFELPDQSGNVHQNGASKELERLRGRRRKEEGGRRKEEEGGRTKEEGGRRKGLGGVQRRGNEKLKTKYLTN
jgi:hypothetical protein